MRTLERAKNPECAHHGIKHVSVARCRVLENELHPAEQRLCHFLCLKKINK